MWVSYSLTTCFESPQWEVQNCFDLLLLDLSVSLVRRLWRSFRPVHHRLNESTSFHLPMALKFQWHDCKDHDQFPVHHLRDFEISIEHQQRNESMTFISFNNSIQASYPCSSFSWSRSPIFCAIACISCFMLWNWFTTSWLEGFFASVIFELKYGWLCSFQNRVQNWCW